LLATTNPAGNYCRYYGYIMANFLPPKVRSLADQSLACLDIIFNFIVTELSLQSPLKLPQRNSSTKVDTVSSLAREGVACLNMAVNIFGEMPLLHSHVRLDPVLYRDNVSVYRKEYRKMEIT
jgi:glucuronyl/N-acetylglucosaminyl transferase EXT1